MADTRCPFDDKYCQGKQNYFEELKMFAFRSPELVIPSRNNFFAGCPIRNEIERKDICKRYLEYCLKNANEKQH